MQKRRVGTFGVEQFGQIRGGRTSPSGSFVPHFMQNLRAGLLPVPQFVQMRRASGAGVTSGGGGGGFVPGTTPSSASSVAGKISVAVGALAIDGDAPVGGSPVGGAPVGASPAGASPAGVWVTGAIPAAAAFSSRIVARSAAR
jgi:hypothetical protein